MSVRLGLVAVGVEIRSDVPGKKPPLRPCIKPLVNLTHPLFPQSVEALREADVSVAGCGGDVVSLPHQSSILDDKGVTSLKETTLEKAVIAAANVTLDEYVSPSPRHDVTLLQTSLEERDVEVETLKKEVESLNSFQVSK